MLNFIKNCKFTQTVSIYNLKIVKKFEEMPEQKDVDFSDIYRSSVLWEELPGQKYIVQG